MLKCFPGVGDTADSFSEMSSSAMSLDGSVMVEVDSTHKVSTDQGPLRKRPRKLRHASAGSSPSLRWKWTMMGMRRS